MNEKYKKWIEENYPNKDKAHRNCYNATLRMHGVFPELTRVRGHVIELIVGAHMHPHWWLVDSEGNIIDPTASQFIGPLEYFPWDENQPEPTGKCPNCGEYCYDNSFCCSEECSDEYVRYLNVKY